MSINLAGYQIGDLIYDGTRTLVYRGTRVEDEKLVVLKKLRSEYPTFNELLKFRHQYVLTKNLNLPGIVKPIILEKNGNGYVLVMEDVGGISLSDYYRSRPLNLDEFLYVAIALTKILEKLYQNRVIHKDIKPANILINPETKEIFLIDFSIASLLPRETGQLQNPNKLEGTLAYISPEQTGRMNRGIDYRSDFYSLGVTFYQLLTGKLPFVSEEPMELVHCQIAKMSEPPHLVKTDIPQTLGQIAMKLMAKNAEERYQSALGLKLDLEKCFSQWRETGKIQPFELGERDISDNFNIPEKLYGRETEVQTLLDAFDSVAEGTTEIMLVAGLSGIGKTAVVNEIHKPIVRQRGYFIKGKFDQFRRNIPYFALVQAFRNLMEQLLGESDAQLKRWKSTILNALGEKAQVIIEMIPELESLMGKQPPVPELSGSAAQNRFNLLFGKFVRVFATQEHPLVIFVDDLQWADLASLKLMQLLMEDSNMGYLLFLGAYRDNEVFRAHPLMLTLDEIAKSGATLNTITLAPLSEDDLNCLVADTLSCQLEVALPLTELIHQKTKGNPFFATQFLKSLHEDGWINFNWDVGYWQCDMTRVKELALTSDVVEFMATRLDKLPEKTQQLLKLAACIGNQFDLRTLGMAMEQPLVEVAAALWAGLQEGLVLPKDDTYKFFQDINDLEQKQSENVWVSYKFLHDRVQQAAYSLIPEADKSSYHLKIGQSLLRNLSPQEVKEKVLDIVGHLNVSHDLLDNPEQIMQAIQLNLLAGEKAKKSTANAAARDYFERGIKLLENTSWQQQRELTFKLHNNMAEAAFLSGDFAKSLDIISVIKQQSDNILESIKAIEVEIQIAQAQYQQLECLEIALSVLQQLGVELPAYPTEVEIQQEIDDINTALDRMEIAEIGRLPAMDNPKIEAATRILAAIVSSSYQVRPTLFKAIAIRQLKLTMQYGITAQTPVACALYGMIMTGSWLNVEQGYQFGCLGVELLERPGMEQVKSTTQHLFHNHIRSIKDHARASLKPSLEGGLAGIEAGEYQYSSYSLLVHCQSAYFAGVELDILAENVDVYIKILVRAKQEIAVSSCRIPQQAVANLRNSTAKIELVGEFYDEITTLPELYEKKDGTNIAYILVHKLALSCLFEFEDVSQSIKSIEEAEQFIGNLSGMTSLPAFYFYNCLLRLRGINAGEEKQKNINLDRFDDSLEILRKFATHAPVNHKHKLELVEAEYHQFLGKKLEAMEFYDRAIAGAKANEYIQEEALANELAAKFYLEWGKEKVASGYMLEAYYCYARWGAKAKVEDLEKRYPQLLATILERQKLDFMPSATFATMTVGTIAPSNGGIEETLDLAALMKASRALSEEISLDGAIANLMQVIGENAGAETVALMLFEKQVLMLSARIAGDEYPKIDPIPVEASHAVPLSIVNKVKRARKPLVLENASEESVFAGDPYIRSSQPQSILCLPLVDRARLIGILYLENNRVAGAFTSDRVEVLSLLCSQAAISLENARLYGESLDYAEQLEQAQLQLVQNEKMASIGQLVSGVAHEINNPLGFITGNLDCATEYIQNLIELLELYQQGLTHNSQIIQDKIEEIDLGYLLEDFPAIISSMKEGTDRITEISKSMRTFSRSDTASKVPFDLHDGIDSTLLILKHRLKANQKRPEIEAVTNYETLPLIECYPGQLNQVFMNLLANALDAFEEANEGKTYEEITANPNRITITTVFDEKKQEAIIKIGDNGPGMPEQVKEKIFEHLFTTKAVGKGTGLGLSISREIVVKKHGGKINFTSEVGWGTEFCIALPLS